MVSSPRKHTSFSPKRIGFRHDLVMNIRQSHLAASGRTQKRIHPPMSAMKSGRSVVHGSEHLCVDSEDVSSIPSTPDLFASTAHREKGMEIGDKLRYQFLNVLTAAYAWRKWLCAFMLLAALYFFVSHLDAMQSGSGKPAASREKIGSENHAAGDHIAEGNVKELETVSETVFQSYRTVYPEDGVVRLEKEDGLSDENREKLIQGSWKSYEGKFTPIVPQTPTNLMKFPKTTGDFGMWDLNSDWGFEFVQHNRMEPTTYDVGKPNHMTIEQVPTALQKSATRVQLPHSWNTYDSMRGDWVERKNVQRCFLRQGVGWYHKTINIDSELSKRTVDGGKADVAFNKRQRLFIHFEQAAIDSTYFQTNRHSELVRTHEHHAGYSEVVVDITDHSRSASDSASDEAQMHWRSSTDVIAAVSNEYDRTIVPSEKNDFYIYGGLTGKAWLHRTGPVRIQHVFMHLPKEWISGKYARYQAKMVATIRLDSTYVNLPPEEVHSLYAQWELESPTGELVAFGKVLLPTRATTVDIERKFQVGNDPDLLKWSMNTPNLYLFTIKILADGKVSDVFQERIGFRHYEFDEFNPFKLNGVRTQLYGTNRHDDWAGEASAVSDEHIVEELKMIKDAGFNFLRLAHYPQRKLVLDTCDELGLAVWIEIPWSRGGIGGPRFRRNTRKMLEMMVAQNQWHPSVMFWGLGNELDVQEEYSLDYPVIDVNTTVDVLKEFSKHLRKIDPGRMTIFRRCEQCREAVDVYSPSMWPGWYQPGYMTYEDRLTDNLARIPRMIHGEFGGSSHYGRHCEESRTLSDWQRVSDPNGYFKSWKDAAGNFGDWSETFIVDVFNWIYTVQRKYSIAGSVQWSFKDYGSPVRAENPIPCVNQKGIVTRDGRPKDAYWLIKAHLQTQQPVCRIESPNWQVRSLTSSGANTIRVFSNCEYVKLSVEGQNIGVQRRNESALLGPMFEYYVAGLAPGKNSFRLDCDCRSFVEAAVKERESFGPFPTERWKKPRGSMKHEVSIQYIASSGKGRPSNLKLSTERQFYLDQVVTRVHVQLMDVNDRMVTNCRQRGWRVIFSVTDDGNGAHVPLAFRGVMGGSHIIELANGHAYLDILSDNNSPCTVEVRALVSDEDIRPGVLTFQPFIK